MRHNVKKEVELYAPMTQWLQRYLEEKYPKAIVTTIDSHARTLDLVLESAGIIAQYPSVVGLDIQIDVLGIIHQDYKPELVFIEAKKTQLNLHDLGQLWAYCKLCDPREAFLLSSCGMGSLNKILINLGRQDLLEFGDGRRIKKMRVGIWDVAKMSIESHSLVPKM